MDKYVSTWQRRIMRKSRYQLAENVQRYTKKTSVMKFIGSAQYEDSTLRNFTKNYFQPKTFTLWVKFSWAPIACQFP